MNGHFITLEGGEGTGKSTQAQALAGHLESRGLEVVLTREPGGTPGAETIRELLLAGTEEKWDMRTEAMLFAATRSDHVVHLIRPALARGAWVVSDRFIDSSRTYQTRGALEDTDILKLHAVGSNGLMPDRTFILDLPDAVAAQRAHARDRGDSDRIGGRPATYHSAVMQSFRDLAAAEPHRVRLIDASRSVEEVTKAMMQNLTDLLE